MEASTALARFRSLELSPARFYRLALLNLGGLWLIVGSGAAVRLTDSGLGCRHWPGCERGHPALVVRRLDLWAWGGVVDDELLGRRLVELDLVDHRVEPLVV